MHAWEIGLFAICFIYQKSHTFSSFSGGPLSVLDNGRYYLLGITSAGFDCARPLQVRFVKLRWANDNLIILSILQPGIYHNVQKTYKWIQNIIYNNS